MTTYFVSRHEGALQWAKLKGLAYDVHLSHLTNFDVLQADDVIIGTLPINLVFQLNERGIRYVHLCLEIPPELRGVELKVQQLDACNASLEEFVLHKVVFNV